MSPAGQTGQARHPGPVHCRPGRRAPGWWVLAALLMALLWWSGSPGTSPLPVLLGTNLLDWAAHLVLGAALGYCLARATGDWTLAWVLAAWLGAFDSLHRAFVPPHLSGLIGWGFGLLGAWLGVRRAERVLAAGASSQDG